MDRIRTIAKLARNALRYRLLEATGRPGRLQAVSLEVSHRCICRCQMCNIWQIPSDVSDLPLDAWTDLLSSRELERLVEIDSTGGEPFLRQNLAALIDWIGRAKAATFPALKTLAITTNGLLTDRVLAVVGGAIGPLRASGIDLVLACGVDAVGPLHDRIRNFRGAWEKLTATRPGLRRCETTTPTWFSASRPPFVPANVGEIDRLAAFADEHGLFTIISPPIITANRFGNTDLSDALSFSPADRRALLQLEYF